MIGLTRPAYFTQLVRQEGSELLKGVTAGRHYKREVSRPLERGTGTNWPATIVSCLERPRPPEPVTSGCGGTQDKTMSDKRELADARSSVVRSGRFHSPYDQSPFNHTPLFDSATHHLHSRYTSPLALPEGPPDRPPVAPPRAARAAPWSASSGPSGPSIASVAGGAERAARRE
jgi:hypothetical protein